MTINDTQRVMMVLFAAREVGADKNLDAMRAICYVMRNRVRAGWHDGSWMRCLENAEEVAAHPGPSNHRLDPDDRNLQRLMYEIDDIYFGHESQGWNAIDATKDQQGTTIESAIGTSLYWMFLKRPLRDWFKDKIIADHENHPQRTQLGLMMFFK